MISIMFDFITDIIGYRLETERQGELSVNAMLCYICAGNVEKLVDCWAKNTDNLNEGLALQVC